MSVVTNNASGAMEAADADAKAVLAMVHNPAAKKRDRGACRSRAFFRLLPASKAAL